MNRHRLFALLLAAALASPFAARSAVGDAAATPPPVTQTPGAGLPVPAEEIKEPKPIAPAPAEEPLLPKPAGPILDQSNVLRSDATAALTAYLLAGREKGVHVYLLTVPTLRVLPSKQSEVIDALGERYAKAWTTGVIGAVVLFDDEGGLMTVALSPDAKARFSEFVIELAIKDSMKTAPDSGLARDRLTFASEVVTDALVKLETEYRASARRQRTANIIMALLALLGLGLIVQSALRGEKKPAPAGAADAGAESETPPRV